MCHVTKFVYHFVAHSFEPQFFDLCLLPQHFWWLPFQDIASQVGVRNLRASELGCEPRHLTN